MQLLEYLAGVWSLESFPSLFWRTAGGRGRPRPLEAEERRLTIENQETMRCEASASPRRMLLFNKVPIGLPPCTQQG